MTDDEGAVIMTADGNSGDPKLGRENLKKVKWSDRGLIHKLALNGKYYYRLLHSFNSCSTHFGFSLQSSANVLNCDTIAPIMCLSSFSSSA